MDTRKTRGQAGIAGMLVVGCWLAGSAMVGGSVLEQGEFTWGGAGTVAVSADYDGDGLVDPALYQPDSGEWYVLFSSQNYADINNSAFLGGPGFEPLLGDFDGDGKNDPSVYSEAIGEWFSLLSTSGYIPGATATLGGPGYNPVPADYDGDGTTEIAVIALGDTVAFNSVRFGGNKLDTAVAAYIRKKFNLIIGKQTAEDVKIQIGAVMPLKKELKMEVSGSNAVTGLPESIMLTSTDIMNGIKPVIAEIINAVKVVLQQTPPELSSDVMEKGIIITGGGALLREIDTLLSKVTGVPCQVAEDPLTCVARGAGMAVENLDAYKRSVLWAR